MIETSMKDKVFGVQISLERTTYAIVDIRGNIVAKDEFPTMEYPTVNDFVSGLCEHLVNMMLAHNLLGAIRSVGVSAPSSNFMTGCIEHAVNLPWKGVIPLAAMMRDQLGIAVALGNMAHVRALGEYEFGAAHGLKNFVVMTLGHGVCSFIYSNGQPYQGADGFAGEMGHACLIPDGRECGCGKKGCLEAYVNERGVLQTVQEVLGESREPSLLRGDNAPDVGHVIALCGQGDSLAIEVMRRTGRVLGWQLANYASILDPEAFIFTGSLASAGKWLLEPAEKAYNEIVFHNIQGKTRFVLSSLDYHLCDILGASVLAWEVKEYSLFK